MTTPLLEVIRYAYPEASITYVAGTWSKVIPEHHPAVNTVIDCGTVGIPGRYSLNDYMKFARHLRRHHFDLAFVLDRSPLLTLLPWLAGIPRRVGPDSLARGFSLTDRVPVSSSPDQLQHQAEIYLDLARAIGLPIGAPRMRFEPGLEERQTVSPPTRMRIALFTGGGNNPGMELTAKRWPLERYRELATERVERRIALTVLRLAAQIGKRISNEEMIVELPLSRQDMAEASGTTIFTVSRVLADWERRGLVEAGRERVVIRNPHGLVQISEGLDQ